MSGVSGAQRAALVLLALDEDLAAEVMRHFEEEDLKRLAACADTLDPIPMEQLGASFEEFERRMREPQLPRGAGNYVRQLAARSFGEDKARLMLAPHSEKVSAIDTIRAARIATLAELLSEEHPQVAAVMISQLPRDRAAKVMQALAPERRTDLLTRIGALKEVPLEVVQLASESLAKALAAAGGLDSSAEPGAFDGVAFTAGLLNDLGPEESARLLAAIGETNSELVPKIREAMFTFEDLERIPSRGIQVLMREIQSDQLLYALKTASEGLREKFLSAVSSRAAAALREDLAALPPTRLSDVEKAQRAIVEAALRLGAEGKLVLPGSTEEKLV